MPDNKSLQECCPICKGSGRISAISDLTNTQKKTMRNVLIVRQLVKEGWSYRRIMKHLNFSSTSVVAYYLNHGK